MGWTTSKWFDLLAEQFKPEKTTILEKMRLLFKKLQTDWELVYEDELIRTSNYTDYKILNGKKYILDKSGCTTISLGTIIIG